MKAALATVAGWITGAAISLIAVLLTVAMIAGAMFYRTECPSEATWSFNLIPFIASYDPGATACRQETATSYYAGKVPYVGGALRGVVRSIQDQGR